MAVKPYTISNTMQTIKVFTLFDITNTDIIRPYKIALMQSHPSINSEAEWIIARKQQTNFETILQVLSLRTQPSVLHKPIVKTGSLNKFKINKKGKIWSVVFTIEHDSVYFNGIRDLGLLEEDCEHVPMIINLDESITDEYLQVGKNIYFEIEKNDLS